MISSREQLESLRTALLALHKTLVDSERIGYEQTIGSIESPNHFLQLLMQDPWFTWLQPLSLLIVAMDEALEEKSPLTESAIEAFAKQSRAMLLASEEGEGFSKHYFEALQRDPDVVLAHADVTKVLGPGPKPAEGKSN